MRWRCHMAAGQWLETAKGRRGMRGLVRGAPAAAPSGGLQLAAAEPRWEVAGCAEIEGGGWWRPKMAWEASIYRKELGFEGLGPLLDRTIAIGRPGAEGVR